MSDIPADVVLQDRALQLEALKAIYEFEIMGVESPLTADWPGPRQLTPIMGGVPDYMIAAYCELVPNRAETILRRLEADRLIHVRNRNVGGQVGYWILSDGRRLRADFVAGSLDLMHVPRAPDGSLVESEAVKLRGKGEGYFHQAKIIPKSESEGSFFVHGWDATTPKIITYSLTPRGVRYVEAAVLRESEAATTRKPRRGRPPATESERASDERILRDWESSSISTYAEFARMRGMQMAKVKRAINSAKARRRNTPKD